MARERPRFETRGRSVQNGLGARAEFGPRGHDQRDCGAAGAPGFRRRLGRRLLGVRSCALRSVSRRLSAPSASEQARPERPGTGAPESRIDFGAAERCDITASARLVQKNSAARIAGRPGEGIRLATAGHEAADTAAAAAPREADASPRTAEAARRRSARER